MIAPGLLVLVTPFVIGILFGPVGVAGVLAGAIVSGVQMAISFSNAGGAWDNAKKYIEGKMPFNKRNWNHTRIYRITPKETHTSSCCGSNRRYCG